MGCERIEGDLRDSDSLDKAVRGVTAVYHLAALLSAVAESSPQKAWKINMEGLFNALEVSRENGCSLFVPSSIGAFGPDTPLDDTPQDTIMRPHSMYGVTKVSGELLCDYYNLRFGVDTRIIFFYKRLIHKRLISCLRFFNPEPACRRCRPWR